MDPDTKCGNISEPGFLIDSKESTNFCLSPKQDQHLIAKPTISELKSNNEVGQVKVSDTECDDDVNEDTTVKDANEDELHNSSDEMETLRLESDTEDMFSEIDKCGSPEVLVGKQNENILDKSLIITKKEDCLEMCRESGILENVKQDITSKSDNQHSNENIGVNIKSATNIGLAENESDQTTNSKTNNIDTNNQLQMDPLKEAVSVRCKQDVSDSNSENIPIDLITADSEKFAKSQAELLQKESMKKNNEKISIDVGDSSVYDDYQINLNTDEVTDQIVMQATILETLDTTKKTDEPTNKQETNSPESVKQNIEKFDKDCCIQNTVINEVKISEKSVYPDNSMETLEDEESKQDTLKSEVSKCFDVSKQDTSNEEMKEFDTNSTVDIISKDGNANLEGMICDKKSEPEISDQEMNIPSENSNCVEENSKMEKQHTKSPTPTRYAEQTPVDKESFSDEEIAKSPKPGTSAMDLETSDEIPEMEDTLGLLAEAKPMMSDDGDDDEEEEADDDDDEADDIVDEANYDDESNQLAPDSSENDSNQATEFQESEKVDEGGRGEDMKDSFEALETEIETRFAADLKAAVTADADSIKSEAADKDEAATEALQVKEEAVETPIDFGGLQSGVSKAAEMAAILAPSQLKTEEPEPDADGAMDGSGEPDLLHVKKEDGVGLPVSEVKEEIVDKSIADIEKVTAPASGEKEKEEKEKGGADISIKDAVETTTAHDVPDVPTNADKETVKEVEKEVTKDVVKENDKAKEQKTKKLEICKPNTELSIVEIEDSDSDGNDVQETAGVASDGSAQVSDGEKEPSDSSPQLSDGEKDPSETTTVNIPSSIDVISASATQTSEMISKDSETSISGIPVPTPVKKGVSRINTNEITIKTATPKKDTDSEPNQSPKFSLEVFNVSDDEDDKSTPVTTPKKLSAIEQQQLREVNECVNFHCARAGAGGGGGGGDGAAYVPAPGFVLSYYEAKRHKRNSYVCAACFDKAASRMQGMMEGVKEMRPLLELDLEKEEQSLVEISDSDSESEGEEQVAAPVEKISPATAQLIEEEIAAMMNSTWRKYKLEERLTQAEDELKLQVGALEKEFEGVTASYDQVQRELDTLRNSLYLKFAPRQEELLPFYIWDSPKENPYVTAMMEGMVLPETQDQVVPDAAQDTDRRAKRLKRGNEDDQARQQPLPAIPLGYKAAEVTQDAPPGYSPAPLPLSLSQPGQRPGILSTILSSDVDSKLDDSGDVAVVKLSQEVAPASLPPVGEVTRAPLRVGDAVYAQRHSNLGAWGRARVCDIWPKGQGVNRDQTQFTMFKVRFDSKPVKGSGVKHMLGRQVAYAKPLNVRYTIGSRVIAQFNGTEAVDRKFHYAGIVAEVPNPVNNFRYLVFFDDGYAQYVDHTSTLLVCEVSPWVWDDVHQDSRAFVHKYLTEYPERPMVRLHADQSLKTEWNGKWLMSRVVVVDASLAQVRFDVDGRVEWVYRGSTRLAPLFLALQAAGKHRPRCLTRPNRLAPVQQNVPYVEYTRNEDQQQQQANAEEARRQQQRAVAKKSTSAAQQQVQTQPAKIEEVMSRVVYYSPKQAIKPWQMVSHNCGPSCQRKDTLPLKDLKTYNPLARPLLSGWERQILRHKGKRTVMYRAPCGRRLRTIQEIHRYLRLTLSEMSVDLFDFNVTTHCLAEFVLNRCYVSKKDLSHGKENVPIPCVNYYDNSLPEFCSYNTERTPTAGVPLNLDPDFLCGCDCTDDCQDKSKCACWQLTLEGARTIGLDEDGVGYVYKRLPEPLPTGIYECNSRCKCAKTCLNRVAQHPLQLKLQVFKTSNRGWGIRALNDVPKGAFLCVYAGNLLTDATANLDGINEGDEYLAELDYIEVLERMKEGYESDVPDEDKSLDKDGKEKSDDDEEEDEDDDDDEMRRKREDRRRKKHDPEDVDFRPPEYYMSTNRPSEFNKRLRERKEKEDTEREKEREKERDKEKKDANGDDTITISDDEEVREPSRFTAQAGLCDDDYVPKYRSVRSFFGKDEACYIMDAKVQGNIGRYLNHSCSPNVFVQNVFVDTHDPRFPWVAFFALCHVPAGAELTWNYNYDIGSVPGKVMHCKCGAPNCRGRLL